MRLVTCVAFDIAHVVLGYNLGESRRLCTVGLVAPRAQRQGLGKLRNDISRVADMLPQRSVAGFAVDSSVLAGFLQLHDIGVTVFAGLMACVSGLASGNLLQGIAAIMTVLPETLGNEVRPKDEKDDNANSEYGCEPEKMLDVLKFTHGSNPRGVPCVQDNLGAQVRGQVRGNLNTSSVGRDSVTSVTA